MANTDLLLQQASSRLSQFDEVIAKQKEAILAKVEDANRNSQQIVDKKKFILEFADYCICKIYGVKQPAYRKIHSGLFRDKNSKYTTALYLYFYWKITDNSQRIIADDFKISRGDVNRKIQIILDESDVNCLAKNRYITTQINNFIDHI